MLGPDYYWWTLRDSITFMSRTLAIGDGTVSGSRDYQNM
jgi:hypothetical protein